MDWSLWSVLDLLNLRGWAKLAVISFLETCAISVGGSTGACELFDGVCVGAAMGSVGWDSSCEVSMVGWSELLEAPVDAVMAFSGS